MGKSSDPVVVHLDRSVAIDLLQALTQALEPYSSNIADIQKAPSPQEKSSKTKSPKGKKRSR
jgi:hypothetical protein